jgi:hypothetical protein
MKKLLLSLVLLLFTILSFGQETEFKFTKEGFTDYVITKVDSSKTQSELYKRALDWVQVTYKNPKEVLLAQIENDYIRFEGVEKYKLCTKSLGATTCFDIRYQIEVSFKNGKYKFDVIKVEQYIKTSQYSAGGWYDFPINNTSSYYKDNGEIRQMWKLYPESLENVFNSLNLSLKNFMLNKDITSKTKDW